MPAPEYEKSVKQIFFEMTWTIIKSENNLSVLYKIDGPNRNYNLSFWIPDLKHGWIRKYGVLITLADKFRTKKIIPFFSIDPECKILKLKYKIIDEISHIKDHISVFKKLPFFSALKID